MTGNCCDTSNLIVALAREDGISADISMDIVNLKAEHGTTMYGHNYMSMANGIIQTGLALTTHSES